MAILGIAMTFMEIGTRKKHFARSIGFTLLIGFHYWIVHEFAIGVGRGNVLPPMIAGWIANTLFPWDWTVSLVTSSIMLPAEGMVVASENEGD